MLKAYSSSIFNVVIWFSRNIFPLQFTHTYRELNSKSYTWPVKNLNSETRNFKNVEKAFASMSVKIGTKFFIYDYILCMHAVNKRQPPCKMLFIHIDS